MVSVRVHKNNSLLRDAKENPCKEPAVFSSSINQHLTGTANGKPRETLHEAACYGNVTLRFRIVNLIIADASCTINVNPA